MASRAAASANPRTRLRTRAGGPSTPTLVYALLAALLLFSFALRVWHGSFLPDGSRYYDEQFSVRNVAAVLMDGSWEPSNAFYPSLSYMPQTAVLAASEGLHRLTGIEWLTIYADSENGFGPTTYFLSRSVSALFGTLSLLALFLLGRRLFGPWVGFWAAVLWGAMPPHLGTSAIFKPDILVALLTVVGFGWCLDAVFSLDPAAGREAPASSPRRAFAKAGAGIGLVVAAKYTGVGIAIPLAAGTFWASAFRGATDGGTEGASLASRLRSLRRWRLLVGAGLVSILTFLVLNPFLLTVLRYVPRLWRIGEQKAELYDSTPWDVAAGELSFLWHHHGAVVFVLAAVGMAGLVGVAAGWGRGLEEAAPRWWPIELRGGGRAAAMILAYVFGYSVLYALGGKVFRGQNYVPVGAFTSLAAAWAGLSLWQMAWRRGEARSAQTSSPAQSAARPLLAGLLGGLALLAVLTTPARVTYREAVPTTLHRATALLLQRFGETASLRYGYYEREGDPLRVWSGRNRVITIPVEVLPEAGGQALDRADVEIFPAHRLEGAGAEPYLHRLVASGVEEVERLSPEPFRWRGPEIVVALHLWKLVEEPRPLAGLLRPARLGEAGEPGAFVLDLAPALGPAPPDTAHPAAGDPAGEPVAGPAGPGPAAASTSARFLSLAVWLPLERGKPRPRSVWIGGEEARLFETRAGGRRARYITGRVPIPEGARQLPVRFDDRVRVDEPPEGRLLLWRAPQGRPGP